MSKSEKVGSWSTVVEVAPTVVAEAYGANDVLGSDSPLSLTPAIRLVSTPKNLIGTGTIVNVMVTDKAAQTATIDIVFWDSNPSATTFTNNTALTVHDTDLLNIIGVITIDTWTSFAASSVGRPANSTAIPFKLASGDTTLYATMITRGTPTYASTSDLLLRVGIYQD